MLANNESIKSQISGDDFINIIKNDNSMNIPGIFVEYAAIKFNNVLVEGGIQFDKNFKIGKTLIIDSCVFENEFIFNDNDIEKNILIKDCIFKSGLNFEGIYEVKNIKSVISIYDSQFYAPLNIMSYRFEKLLQIKRCRIDDFDITRSDLFKLIIEESTFINGFSIDYNVIKDSKIQYNKFYKHLGITGNHFNIFKLLDNTISGNAVLKRNTVIEESEISEDIIDGNLDLIDNTFEGKVYLHALNVRNKIDLSSNTARSDLDVYKVSSESIHILSGTFDKGIFIHETNILKDLLIAGGNIRETLNVYSGVINRIFISVVSSSETIIIEERVVLSYFEITSVLPKDSFIYFNTNCNYIKFNHFKNFGSIFFTNVSSEINNDNSSKRYGDVPTLSIINSDLGKIVFINCDLSVYELDFFSSKITDIFVAGTTMPEYIKGNDTRQKKLGYSQIKKVYENRGDKVESNRFFAKEMDSYFKSLHWFYNFWEWFNLWLSKISTVYGQSWQRGLASTLVVSIILFSSYCVCLGIYPYFIIEGIPISFGKVSSFYLEFINPIHKADYIAEQLLGQGVEVNSSARWVEGISRIFIAYFLYQFIQAFRKHGKSSS